MPHIYVQKESYRVLEQLSERIKKPMSAIVAELLWAVEDGTDKDTVIAVDVETQVSRPIKRPVQYVGKAYAKAHGIAIDEYGRVLA